MDVTPKGVFLSALDETVRATLLERATNTSSPAGSVIFSRGEEGNTLYLITGGQVEISVTSLNGRQSILAILEPGDVFGEIALLDGGHRSADAKARTDVTLLAISRRDIMAFFAERPEAMMTLVAELCARVRNASDMFETQTHSVGKTRLARVLLRLSEQLGDETADGNLRIPADFSQGAIGDMAGLARENVNRHLKAWGKEGLVAQQEAGLEILDPDRLAEIGEL